MRPTVWRATFFAALLASTSAATFTARQPRWQYAIQTGQILDPRTGRFEQGTVLLIRGGKIMDAVPGAQFREGLADSVIDLRRFTVLPGLIDAHVHLAIGGPVAQNARADLRAGFTTVVDLGARTLRLLRIRDSINAGMIPGPRVLAAGMWVGIKGGVCEFNGLGIDGTADAFRARIRENVQGGADIIKLCVSGWPNEAHSDPQKYEISDAVLIAAVDESRKAGKLVIAHDISVGGVQSALRAGVQGFAHTPYLDSATARQLLAQQAFIIPTIASLTGTDTSPPSRDLIRSLALAHRLGVTLVFGTDGGVLPHGGNAEEFLALARAGITPLEAIRAATINAARPFGLADSLGVLARGMAADIIAVEGNPLENLSTLQRPTFVMSRGRVVPLH
jgi:imidazolonepropionase-like amidohydrolase